MPFIKYNILLTKNLVLILSTALTDFSNQPTTGKFLTNSFSMIVSKSASIISENGSFNDLELINETLNSLSSRINTKVEKFKSLTASIPNKKATRSCEWPKLTNQNSKFII